MLIDKLSKYPGDTLVGVVTCPGARNEIYKHDGYFIDGPGVVEADVIENGDGYDLPEHSHHCFEDYGTRMLVLTEQDLEGLREWRSEDDEENNNGVELCPHGGVRRRVVTYGLPCCDE